MLLCFPLPLFFWLHTVFVFIISQRIYLPLLSCLLNAKCLLRVYVCIIYLFPICPPLVVPDFRAAYISNIYFMRRRPPWWIVDRDIWRPPRCVSRDKNGSGCAQSLWTKPFIRTCNRKFDLRPLGRDFFVQGSRISTLFHKHKFFYPNLTFWCFMFRICNRWNLGIDK